MSAPWVQGYADNVQVSSWQEGVIPNMLDFIGQFLKWLSLDVKQAKSFALDASLGIRPRKTPPPFLFKRASESVYSRLETYFTWQQDPHFGEWGEQVLHRLHLVELSQPLTSAIVHNTLTAIWKMTNANVELVKGWLQLAFDMWQRFLPTWWVWVGVQYTATRYWLFNFPMRRVLRPSLPYSFLKSKFKIPQLTAVMHEKLSRAKLKGLTKAKH